MYDKLILPNGARIVFEHMDGVRSASVGVWVGVGSRHEKYSEAGCAHFIEHMLFKGTPKYSAAQLAEVMDAVGGQINAYTTRDNTCFYARVLDTQLPLATDVLSDMFFDSLFDEDDTANERGIILEEIDMYEDTPEDVAAERLLNACFPGALGRPVLGRAASLKRQTGASLRAFRDANYLAPRVVIALAGSFCDADIAHIAERFSVMPKAKPKKPAPSAYTPAFMIRKKATEQNQLVLGFPGLPTASDDRFAMQLLSGILGGNASSRLFQTVREKNGLCYSIYSFASGFADSGLFAIATATNRDTEARAIALITEQLRKICDDGVTEGEFERARQQMEASLLMSLESTGSRMNRLGYGELFLDGSLTTEELIARYDAVTRDDLLRLARETLNLDRLSLSAVGRCGDADYYRSLINNS
ncbi:MAG: pitrilysin family protein [Oscillospiraceae bacterium]